MRALATKLALASGLLCVTSFAQAQTDFYIYGTITGGTCTISVNGGVPAVVGTFSSSLFTGSFQSGFIPNFNISYTNCAAGIKTLQFKLTGTADGNNSAYWASGLPGAPFELRDGKTSANLPPSGATLISITNPGTSGTYPLTAQFHQTAPLSKVGAGTATVTLNATYL